MHYGRWQFGVTVAKEIKLMGFATNITIDTDDTISSGGEGSKEAVEARVQYARNRLDGADSDDQRAALRARFWAGARTTALDRVTAPLGDIITAAFDEAARRSTDPQEILRLATDTVRRLVGRVPHPESSW